MRGQLRSFWWGWLGLALLISASPQSAVGEAESNSLTRPHDPISDRPNVGALRFSQSTDSPLPGFDLTKPEGEAIYCKALVSGKVYPAALQSVCEFALSLRWKLPNVIGEEERNRYQEGQLGGEEQKNKITAKIRYEDGQEEYSDVRIDGKPVKSVLQDSSSAIWSVGEFAADLRGIFSPQSATEFRFVKEDVLRSVRALIFDFRVEKANNRVWRIEAGDKSVFPGFRGRLWIDKSTSQLMRLERRAEVDSDFPVQVVNTAIDYADIRLADGTNFVLPVQAVNLNCPTVASSHCWHDRLTFKHWQKFAARARILTGEEGTAASPAAISTKAGAAAAIPSMPDLEFLAVARDLRRGVNISTEILSRQMAGVEPVEELKVATGQIEASAVPARQTQWAVSGARGSRSEPENQIPVIKASVRLVLVPAVVRDSQGHTVDGLQKSNFRLFDERKPQAITHFSLEHPNNVLSKRAQVSEESGEPNAPASRFAAYVFDDIHATPGDLGQARDAARRHLVELKAGDRAAIIALSGSVALDFTNDAAKLKDGLMHLQPHPLTATGSVRCPDISYAQADLIQNQNDATALGQATEEAIQCAYGGDATARIAASAMARDTAAQVLLTARAESQTSFNVLEQVVRRVASMPGRRAIVLVSPGFPIAEMEQESSDIIEEALRGQVIINVLDPSGLSTDSPIEFRSTSSPSDVLMDLTSGTGGTFFHNRNDVDEGFAKTALPELFYVLGFSPQKLDGKFHRLKVDVQQEKLSVQARRGYYALKAQN